MRASQRAGHQRFVEAAASMRADIERFAGRAEPPPDSKLKLAVEELRAQNETLQEACSRLERETAKYRHLYDSAPDAFVTTDDRGIILDANPAMAKLLGFRHDLLAGKLLIAFVARRDTVAFRAHLRSIASGSGHGTFSVRMRPRGGSPFVAHLAVRTLRNKVQAINEPSKEMHWSIRADPSQGTGSAIVYDLLESIAGELRDTPTLEAMKPLLQQLAVLLAFDKDAEPAAEIDLDQLVVQALERVRAVAAARGLGIDMVCGARERRALARAGHLLWAIHLLLAQAVQAVPGRGVLQVHVAAEMLGAALEVRSTTAQALGGSRLTVAIARAVIEREGGTLHVPEAADQEDVLFHVRLPRLDAPG